MAGVGALTLVPTTFYLALGLPKAVKGFRPAMAAKIYFAQAESQNDSLNQVYHVQTKKANG
jgi:hypothetical protein